MVIRKLDFYTDGAYSSKTEMGGWGCICVEDDNIIKKDSGYEPYTTNNRMELTGFLCALEQANSIESHNIEVTINVDSAYIANTINLKWYENWRKNGWRTADHQDVKNQDLWKRIIALYIKLSQSIKLQVVRVPAHKNNDYNNIVDRIAVQSRVLAQQAKELANVAKKELEN